MSTTKTTALLLNQFRSVLADLGVCRQHPIAVALSGGSDSLALALLTSWWKASEASGVVHVGGLHPGSDAAGSRTPEDRAPPLMLDLVRIARDCMAGRASDRGAHPSGWMDCLPGGSGGVCGPGSSAEGRSQPAESQTAVAFVVDHGLRAESAAEAAAVAAQAQGFGMQAEVLTIDWRGQLPKHGHRMAAARQARYQLLARACRRRGIGTLLVGHIASDQAETTLLRLSRASGIGGLGAMTVSRTLPVNTPSQLNVSLGSPAGEPLESPFTFAYQPHISPFSAGAQASQALGSAISPTARQSGEDYRQDHHHIQQRVLVPSRGTEIPALRQVRPLLQGASSPDEGTGPDSRLCAAGLRVVRPLLWAHKWQLQRLLATSGHRWVEDTTNNDTSYARNFIRGLPGMSPLRLESQPTKDVTTDGTAAPPCPAAAANHSYGDTPGRGPVLQAAGTKSSDWEAVSAQIKSTSAEAALDPDILTDLLTLQRGCAAAEAAAQCDAAAVLAACVFQPRPCTASNGGAMNLKTCRPTPSGCVVDLQVLHSARLPARRRVLSAIMQAVSSGELPPAQAAVERLLKDLDAGGRPGRVVTGGGCAVQHVTGTRGRLAAVSALEPRA